MSLHVISGLGHQQLYTKIGNKSHSICNLSEIYNIPVNHWNFKNTNEQHDHGIPLPLTNWQPFHAYSFFVLFPLVHLVVAERIRGDRGIFWVLKVVHGHYSISKRSQLTKDTLHTERTWIPCAPVCTSSASQTLRTYDLDIFFATTNRKGPRLFSLLVCSFSKYSWRTDHAVSTLIFIFLILSSPHLCLGRTKWIRCDPRYGSLSWFLPRRSISYVTSCHFWSGSPTTKYKDWQ